MTPRTTEVVLEGLVFPEGPRWHDNRLWFSDQHDGRVLAMDADGKAETIVDVPQQPSGLGWLPDGRMLVVSMLDKRVLRHERDGSLALHSDLAPLAPGQCNDMVVDTTGRAYVGNFGFELYGGEKPRDTCLIAVETDGSAHVAAEGLAFPNGSTISPDGRELLVGESMGRRISAFDIDDGVLSNHRTWADISAAKATVDGMCLDAEGMVWAACPFSGRVLRIREGGEIVDEVKGTHTGAFACMLGGADRRTLFICTAPSTEPEKTRAAREGRIEAVEVDVPGAGLPERVRESAADLDELQALLDRSYAAAGEHLRSIFRADRLLRAPAVAELFEGIFEMHLATVTRDGAPLVAPLDGIFFKGQIWFGLPAGSIRAGHVRRDPRVSVSYTRPPAIAVVVHGTAREVGEADPQFVEYDELLRALYVNVYGAGWQGWYDEQRDRRGPGFNGCIDARRMYAKH